MPQNTGILQNSCFIAVTPNSKLQKSRSTLALFSKNGYLKAGIWINVAVSRTNQCLKMFSAKRTTLVLWLLYQIALFSSLKQQPEQANLGKGALR